MPQEGVGSGVVRGEPLRIGGGRFVQAQREELHSLGKLRRDDARETCDEVFARGLELHRLQLAEPCGERCEQLAVLGGAPGDEAVVVDVHDASADDAFEYAEVDHHAVFRILRIVARRARHGDEKTVGMAVYFAAGPVVTLQHVCHLEGELLRYPDAAHGIIRGI